jgi:hypothetical protein
VHRAAAAILIAVSVTLLCGVGHLIVKAHGANAIAGQIKDHLLLTPIGVTHTTVTVMATLTDSWQYATAGGGCATKTVTTTQEPDESLEDFQARHKRLVDEQMKLYPAKAV